MIPYLKLLIVERLDGSNQLYAENVLRRVHEDFHLSEKYFRREIRKTKCHLCSNDIRKSFFTSMLSLWEVHYCDHPSDQGLTNNLSNVGVQPNMDFGLGTNYMLTTDPFNLLNFILNQTKNILYDETICEKTHEKQTNNCRVHQSWRFTFKWFLFYTSRVLFLLLLLFFQTNIPKSHMFKSHSHPSPLRVCRAW